MRDYAVKEHVYPAPSQTLQFENNPEVGIALKKEEMLARVVLREVGGQDVGHIDITAFHFCLDKEMFKERHVQPADEVHPVTGYMPLVVLVKVQQRHVCFGIQNTNSGPFEDIELDIPDPQFSLIQQIVHAAKLDIEVVQPIGVFEFQEIASEFDRLVLVNPVVLGA